MLPNLRLTAICVTATALFSATWLPAQIPATENPAPTVEVAGVSPVASWRERGGRLLEAQDPVGAWQAFRAVDPSNANEVDRSIGLGRAHLMMGHSHFATAYGEGAVAAAPGRQDAMALTIRSLIRGREFDDAVSRSLTFVTRVADLTPDLLAARGSALFRVQRTADSAKAYQQAVGLDHDHAEAHLRLGSGLLGPVTVTIPAVLRLAVGAIAAGQRVRAIDLLQRFLIEHPGHPVAHRLLGETLYAERASTSMAQQDEAFHQMNDVMPRPTTDMLPIADFVQGYEALARSRRLVVERTAALFANQLDKLVAVGGQHDLLHELERTTDAEARANLRGRLTFDGRVWDDVRGVGGMRAATGIEALDEAAAFGFDTFAHEVAHQVHFFTFSPVQRVRVRALYRDAMAEQRCLDYYAASNEAEYFGQGVEAFVSLVKRPGGETTHGHTRFELLRVDPALHDFIAGLVSFDPLADPMVREPLLAAAVIVAIRCGRPQDALVAAKLLSEGELRTRLVRDAREDLLRHRCY